MGTGVFTMFKIDHALDGRTLFSGNWSSDDSVFRDDSRGKCQIFPVDFPACHHGREERGTVKMPGNDQKTGGVPVKPVNAAVDKRLAFLFEIPCTGIGKCVVIISLGRVNWHSGRFIDDQQVRIFIYDRKRQI